MANVPWHMKGKHLKNCNCALGGLCDFNAPPTHGPCESMVGSLNLSNHRFRKLSGVSRGVL